MPQLKSDVEMYAFQYETKTKSSDSTVVLYLEKVRKARVHRRLVGSLVGREPRSARFSWVVQPEDRAI